MYYMNCFKKYTKKLILGILVAGMIMAFCSCGANEPQIEFSDKYLVGDIPSGSSWGDFNFWEKLKLEYRICYDGTVEVYMPTVSNYEVTGYELAGTYQLTDDEIDNLIKSIDQQKLYKLDPQPDYAVCDGSSYTLALYDKNDELLKECGGYMPDNRDFNGMYNAVKNTIHLL